MTDYHSLNTPEQGADDWHLPLNENFRTIDKKIEIRDEAAARSDYPPKAGAKYLATDTGAQWIGDGDEWNRLASTGESPEFSSVSHRDPSGQAFERRCLFSGSPDGEYISIPAEDDYDTYYIRLIFPQSILRISFNDPPADTLARKVLIDDNEVRDVEDGRMDDEIGVLNIYISETDGTSDSNEIAALGPFVSDKYTLGNDPINQIYLDSTASYVEAWGSRSE